MYSAHGSHLSHWGGRSSEKQRRYMMMMRLAASVCPSVCGWKANDMKSFAPVSRISSCQNTDVNTGSWSETMDCGTPCSRTMSTKNTWATDSAV